MSPNAQIGANARLKRACCPAYPNLLPSAALAISHNTESLTVVVGERRQRDGRNSPKRPRERFRRQNGTEGHSRDFSLTF